MGVSEAIFRVSASSWRHGHVCNLATQESRLVVSRDGELTASSVRLVTKVPATVKPEVCTGDG
jgi:hypothetical protein